MRRSWVNLQGLICSLCSTGLFLSPLTSTDLIAASADEEPVSENTLVVKKSKGLRFTVPADWPVSQADGITGPVSVEEYLSMKFSKVAAKMQVLRVRIEVLEKELKAMTEELKGVKEELQKHSGAHEASEAQVTP